MFVDFERGVEVVIKWSELEGMMKMMTVIGCSYPDRNLYGVAVSEFDFDEIERSGCGSRFSSFSFDTERGSTVEVSIMVFDYLDRKGIAGKIVCYYRGRGMSRRRSSSEDSIRALERELDDRSLRRRDDHSRVSALERCYLNVRRRSRERRLDGWRVAAQVLEQGSENVERGDVPVEIEENPLGSLTSVASCNGSPQASNPSGIRGE